ncbi:hypothetical protein ANCCAN_26090, partial [Ancylostoma caninum]
MPFTESFGVQYERYSLPTSLQIGSLRNNDGTRNKLDIDSLKKVLGLSAEKPVENAFCKPRANGETVSRAAALKDEIAMATTDQGTQEDEEQPLESLKEIQGAAELCTRPSKVSFAKSDHELNAKYAALLSNSGASTLSKKSRSTKGSSEDNSGCEHQTQTNNEQPIVLNSSNPNQNTNDGSNKAGGSNSKQSAESEITDSRSSATSSSLVTAEDPSVLYSTAATISFSADTSLSEELSLYTPSSSLWTEISDRSHEISALSTGIWVSYCSDPPSSLCATSSFSSMEVLTADLHTDDVNTAEAHESEIEATNQVFDAVLIAKSENLVQHGAEDMMT